MKCLKCSRASVIEVSSVGSLCSFCFCSILEKRVRKVLRSHDWIKPNERVFFVRDGSLESNVGFFIFKKIVGSVPFVLVEGEKFEGEFDKVIVPWSTDAEVVEKLDAIFKGESFPIKNNNVVRLLKELPLSEIFRYAGFQGIKGVVNRDSLGVLIEGLDNVYPGTWWSLLRGVEGLRED